MINRNGMKQIITLAIFFALLSSCSKDENDDFENPDQPFIFTSLKTEKDTITSGETTKIFAIASGYKLTYNWAASAGDILGTGNSIIYAASPCHAGRNKITCTINDGNNASQSKELFIVVY